MNKKRWIHFTLLIALLLFSFSLSAKGEITENKTGKTLKLAYVAWSSETASAYMIKAALQEKMGVDVELHEVSAPEMYKGVAEGRYDAMAAAWLPLTHKHYYETYKHQLDDLGPNLEGAKIGLVVPDVSPGRQTGGRGMRTKPYMEIDSIEALNEHAEKFSNRIVGIDSGAGIMKKTREAIEAYGLKLRLIEGNEGEMTALLKEAIKRKEWIVVTGWQPHWMFGQWTMKFLDDPKNVFGEAEKIHTLARKGLKADMPKVYQFLDNFQWTPEEMDKLMVWNQMDGADPYRSATRWMKYNQDRVKAWFK